jgi:cytochrome c-type biogenesis protein CcmH
MNTELIPFWLAALVCVVIALAFILPPLLRKKEVAAKTARRDINIAVYRDQMKEMEADLANGLLNEEQYQKGKTELETRLAEDALAKEDAPMTPVASRRLGFTLAAVLPATAFGLYLLLGNPDAISAANNPQPQQVEGSHDIMQMIQQVEEKTRQDPNDVQAWSLLAKTYAAVGHWPEALHAYEKAFKLKPDQASILSGYAEALAISKNRDLSGKPIEMVMQALEIDPNDIKGLELAGIHAFQEKSYAKAAFYMKHLHKQLPPESPYAQDVLAAQQEAESMLKKSATGLDELSNPDAKNDKAAGGNGAIISGKVDISPALKAKVAEKDTLFLFARAAGGSAPVAAIRANAGTFPLEFELNDNMAMSPENSLSKHKEVTLTVRVSKSGDVKAAPGDLEGRLEKVKVGSSDVKLVIDKVIN